MLVLVNSQTIKFSPSIQKMYDAINIIRQDPSQLKSPSAAGKSAGSYLHWSNAMSMACRDIVVENGQNGLNCDKHTTVVSQKNQDQRLAKYGKTTSPIVEVLICGDIPEDPAFKMANAMEVYTRFDKQGQDAKQKGAIFEQSFTQVGINCGCNANSGISNICCFMFGSNVVDNSGIKMLETLDVKPASCSNPTTQT